jgi:hypothetical protein
MTKGTEKTSQIVSAAAGVWVHLRELALVVAGGDLASSFTASGEGNSRGWCRVETMMKGSGVQQCE